MRFVYIFSLLLVMICKLQADETALILVRHGQSQHNVEKFCNSNPEHPAYQVSNLTNQGKSQAALSAQELIEMGFNDSNISIVYVSPLPRTLKTAEILAEAGLFSKDKIVIDPRITEIQCGDAEGMSFPFYPRGAICDQFHVEREDEIESRVQSFYEEALKQHQGQHVLIVSHGHVLKKISERISDDPATILPGGFAVRQFR